jgi:Mn2+/Fe2+ NRAMP family transporter
VLHAPAQLAHAIVVLLAAQESAALEQMLFATRDVAGWHVVITLVAQLRICLHDEVMHPAAWFILCFGSVSLRRHAGTVQGLYGPAQW